MSVRTVRWLMSLPPRRLRVRARDGEARLTIVRHHRVFAAAERPLYRLGVSESVLRNQLRMLADEGLAAITVAEGLAHLDQGQPGHRVAMSFDDGYRDNLERALPLLREHGARATLYLAAGLIEQRSAPWWDVLAHAIECTRLPQLAPEPGSGNPPLPLGDAAGRRRAFDRLLPTFHGRDPETIAARLQVLRERLGVREAAPCDLARWDAFAAWVAAGGELGAHTLTHPFLNALDSARQREEIVGSRTLIEQRLGLRVGGLAYPGGDYDAHTPGIARDAGFAYAVTTRAGVATRRSPRFELPRRGFTEGTCLGPFDRFSRRLALSELDGSFDFLRRGRVRMAS